MKTPTLHACIAPAGALLAHYDPQRIQGYCATCPQTGRYWSCPPFAVPPLQGFPPWDHAVLVTEKVWAPAGAASGNLLDRFQARRRAFRGRLLAAEGCAPGVTALVAGYCLGCEACSRPAPCRQPAALRYSLEAVGFDVSGLVEGIAGQRLHWPKAGLPEYLLTVGALLCPDRPTAELVQQAVVEAGDPAQDE